MGACSPVAGLDDAAALVEQIHQPVIDELARRGTPFVGCLFAGLMLTADGPRVLEFNARFGDPETQVLIPRLEGDLLAALAAAADGGGSEAALELPARRGRDRRPGRAGLPRAQRLHRRADRGHRRGRGRAARSSSTAAPPCAASHSDHERRPDPLGDGDGSDGRRRARACLRGGRQDRASRACASGPTSAPSPLG